MTLGVMVLPFVWLFSGPPKPPDPNNCFPVDEGWSNEPFMKEYFEESSQR